MHFKTVKGYEESLKETSKTLWLILKLKIFQHNHDLFGVYCCPQCDSMAGTEELSVHQVPENIMSRLCIHSKVCSTLLGDWRDIWDVDSYIEDDFINVVTNEDIKFYTLLKQDKVSTLLAAVREQNKIALLYTVTTRQETPFCDT